MEFPYWYLVLISILVLLASLLRRRLSQNGAYQRPPGPRGWPIVGNMFDLGALPHRTLYDLRSKYGPVLWLKLGSVNTIVIQSAESLADLCKNHDQSFRDHTCPHVFISHNYHLGSIIFGRYGPYWHSVRRLCTTELLSNKRVSETAAVRQRCVDDMVRFIAEESGAAVARGESGAVELARFLFVMTFNMMGNLTLSKDLVDPRSDKGREFFDALHNCCRWAGTPNVAEYLPWLKWMDPQGLMKMMRRDLGQAINIVAGFVHQRIEERQKSTGNNKNDNKGKNVFLDTLLNYQGDGREGSQKFSTHQVTIIILEMFFGGTETTSSSLEWAMTELLKNPISMKKAKEELDQVVGRGRKVLESDIDQLPYLQAVVKEVLRLHPTFPMPTRKTSEDTKFMGYMIPKNAQVFVNIWAIGRDGDAWDDPLCFKPERFVGSDIEFKGQNYEFIPFGFGRRICVGMSLGHKILQLALASLVHCFDWELESHLSPETLDMNDSLGITLRKDVRLRAIPKKRN